METLKERYKKGAGVLLPIVLLCWFIWQIYTNGEHQAEARLAARNYATLRQKLKEYQTKAGKREVMANQIITDQKGAIAAGLQEVERLKAVSHQVQEQTRTHYSKISVAFDHPVPIRKDTEPDTMKAPGGEVVPADTLNTERRRAWIRVPAPFHYAGEWLQLSGRVDTNGVFLDSVTSLSKPMITLGMEKQGIKGLWKPPIPVATYSDANPNVRVVDLKVITIAPKRPFYQKPVFIFGAGVLMGGVGWRLIR